MSILNKIQRASGHELYYVQVPLYQRADGTMINDNRGTKKGGFLRLEVWRVTQDQDKFLATADSAFNAEEEIAKALKPGARLSMVIQPEHVSSKKIEAIRAEIFKVFGIDGAEGSKEQKQRVRGGYATLCLVVKAGKSVVTPTGYNSFNQLTVSEVVEYKVHYCTRPNDASVDLYAKPDKVMHKATKEELVEALKKDLPNMKFTL